MASPILFRGPVRTGSGLSGHQCAKRLDFRRGEVSERPRGDQPRPALAWAEHDGRHWRVPARARTARSRATDAPMNRDAVPREQGEGAW